MKRLVVILGLLVVATTGLVNIGIIAVDDYADIVSNVIPAGRNSVAQLVRNADFRSAVPTISLSAISGLAMHLGLYTPTNQLRFVLVTLGLFSLGLQLFFGMRLFRGSKREFVAAFLLSFYFICPLFFTRPMIESLAAPFLTGSMYFATVLFKKNEAWAGVVSAAFLAVASLFRYQAGVCFAALAIVAFLSRSRWRNVVVVLLSGASLFLLTGLIDLKLKGQFHSSLLSYWRFNSQNSSSFGVTPFYTFFLLFVGLSFPFLLISRYRGMDWRKEYEPLFPCALYFLAFVLAHSFVPHKEERFMVTVIPLFLLLGVPIAHYFWQQKAWGRIATFCVLDGLLLVLTSYSVAQNNVVGLGVFLDRHPGIQVVFSFKDSVGLVPDAFIRRSIDWKLNLAAINASELSCSDAVAVRGDYASEFEPARENLKKIGEFRPGLLEGLLVKLNPRRNARRASIELYTKEGCT